MDDLIYNNYGIGLAVSSKSSFITIIKILFKPAVFFIIHAAYFISEHWVETSSAKAAAA